MLLTLGVRTGTIVASAIPITVVGSLLFMAALGISLNKMSLTALIIALGLLVDNAIVISESILVQMREGKSPFSAAVDSAQELRFPLLVSSLTTAAALLPPYLANHAVAEYTSAIFEVVSIALLFSWGLSLTVMPMLCFLYLKVDGESAPAPASATGASRPAPGNTDVTETTWWNPATWTASRSSATGSSEAPGEDAPDDAPADDPGGDGEYDTPFYRWYRGMLLRLVRNRWLALAGAVAVLAGAFWTATQLPEQFIPRKEETLFNAQLEMPDGTPFERTQAVMHDLESFMRDSLQVPASSENPLWAVPRIDETTFEQQGVVNWASWVGSGAPRYILSYNPEPSRPNYAYMLVNTTSYDVQSSVFRQMNAFLDRRYPEATPRLQKLENGPAVPYPVEIRLSGPSTATLQRIADRVTARLRDEPGMTHVSDNWGQRLKQLRVDVDDAQAQRAGLTNEDIGLSVRTSLTGVPLTHFRDGNDRVPVLLRSDRAATRSVASLSGIDVYAQNTGRNVPLTQVADLQLRFDNSKIQRRNRTPTITVRGDLAPTAEKSVTPVSIVQSIKPWLQEQRQSWPQGYRFEIGGEPEQSGSAQNQIRQKMPYAALLIVLLLVAQFNAIREPIIVLLTLPFVLIGVVAGLFLMGLPLDFMGLMGVIALFGIVINNAVVLLDRIEIEMDDFGRDPPAAVLEASQRRLRPILLTTATTIGGLVPLWLTGDVMFTPMAVGMIFGLLVSTLLTLGLVPILYSIFHSLDFSGLTAAARSGDPAAPSGTAPQAPSGDGAASPASTRTAS
jgi:multidrug efflux pump subunit AcrB